jgi:8-oxo-dGTP pyrophosphatase MutT (NUDIX family)
LLGTAGRVLLQEVDGLGDGRPLWITPGGGLEPGESHEAAALREVREEVGHVAASLGPWIWTRVHEFTFRSTRYRQTERFFLALCDPFEVDSSGLDELEVELVKGHRWWALDEIRAATDLVFAPSALAGLLEPLLHGTIPKAPINIGI